MSKYTVPKRLVSTVRGYYNANKNKPNRNYGENWKRVLIAFGEISDDTLTPYTAQEARKSQKVWHGWKPVADALEKLETGAKAEPEPEHSKRPGSPEWRRELFESRVAEMVLPDWDYAEAKKYYREKHEKKSYHGPRVSRNNGYRYWIDFEKTDDGLMRQVDMPVARLKPSGE